MKKPYKNTRIKIIIFTVFLALSLCSVSLFSATPSYSNFSSNQFAPSGTYTVTVKDKPLLTNIVEHAQLSLTNPAFANSLVYITNMRSLTGLTNTMEFVSSYGPQVQFAWTTGGIGVTNIVMVISNGVVGIGTAKPDTSYQFYSPNGVYSGSGDLKTDGNMRCNQMFLSSAISVIGLGENYITFQNLIQGTNGAVILLKATTNVLSLRETPTNTVIASLGTNLYIGDGITANSSNVATMQFSFQTSGTPVMVISNGFVGIGKASPTVPLDVVGQANISGSALVGSDIRAGTSSKIYFQNNAGMRSPAPSYLTFYEPNEGTNGCAFVMPASTNLLSTHETVTNTVIGSQGTNLWIGDGITADATYGQFRQFSFQTSGTPVMVISNGMLGIGKANPGSALDVYGNVNVSSGGLSVDFDVVSGGSRKITWNGNTAGSSPAAGLYGWQSYSGVGNTYTNGAWQIFYGSTLNLSAADNTTNTLVYSDGNALHVTDSLIIHSNVFPITANFGNMGPSDCVFWKSNFTMYLICTNSVDGNATTNKLGGL